MVKYDPPCDEQLVNFSQYNCAKAMNSNAIVMNLTAKLTNSVTNGTNLIANGTNFTSKAINSWNEMNYKGVKLAVTFRVCMHLSNNWRNLSAGFSEFYQHIVRL